MNRLHRLCLPCLSVLILFAAAAPAQVSGSPSPQAASAPFIAPGLDLDPPQGLLVDSWYKLTLLDQPMGYMRTALQRKGDRIESLDFTQIEIARGPITVKVVIKTVAVETVDGKPLEVHTEQVMGSQPVKYDALFRDGGTIDLKITQGGNTIERQLQADPEARLPWASLRETLSGRRKPGESFTERTYAFAADTKPLSVRHEPAGQARFPLPSGQAVEALRYKVHNQGLASAGEMLVEPQLLLPLKLELPVMGMKLIASIATRDQAMARTAEKPAELFESMMVRAKVVPPADPSRAAAVLYTLKFPADAKAIDILATDMQKVTARTAHSLKLLVTRRLERGARSASPAGEQDLDAMQRASAYANSDDPLVRKMAADAAGDEKDPLRLAERLCRYVHANIRHKNFDVAFATASEVARTRQGDCSEHAVLLAALARANGLPARGALGMVALPGSYRDGTMTYGYHMWTQIHVNGRWLDFDAALNQPRPDATHIVLGISDLSDATIPVESINTFAQLAGQLDLAAEPRQ